VTAASEPDILAGVERWARVRGFTLGADPIKHGLQWGVAPRAVHGVTVWCWTDDSAEHRLSPALALAWALLVETDAGPVDVGRCPACKGRGWEEKQCSPVRGIERTALAIQGWGPTGGTFPTDDGEHPTEIWRRPCPACNGTGREVPVARLLLDAASGDPAALDVLLVHADRLQADGDPRGEPLALALGPWSGESVDFGVCPDCKGRGTVPGDPPSWENPYGEPPEECGCGDGRLFGHARTAAALRWLEWLTWAREFDGGYAAALASGVVRNRAEFEALRRAAHGAALTADRLIPDNLGIDLAGRPQGRLPLTVPRW
jgi:hypothetical protein